ncbi:response regulator transcription factor [Serratia fonticola]|uniref:response regulator transcription factor n=1 Tax=Serratia fonticola TaxID=47917 RepID=UPI0021ADD29E|nr:LuxR C-terminal-related transcriptional regulator [Serratia fonticola]
MMRSQSSNINLGVLACTPLMALGLAHYIEDLRLGHCCQMTTMSLTDLEDKLRQTAVSVLIVDLSGSPQEMATIALRLAMLHEHFLLLNIVVYTACCDATILGPLQYQERISLIAQQEQPEKICWDLAEALTVGHVHSPSIKLCLNNMNALKPLDQSLLTRSERNVLIHLFSGLSLTEIAKLFNRSIKTISAHKCNIMRKLGVHCDAELFRIAQRDALLASGVEGGGFVPEHPAVPGL